MSCKCLCQSKQMHKQPFIQMKMFIAPSIRLGVNEVPEHLFYGNLKADFDNWHLAVLFKRRH